MLVTLCTSLVGLLLGGSLVARSYQRGLAKTPSGALLKHGTGIIVLDQLLSDLQLGSRKLEEELEAADRERNEILRRYQALTDNISAAVLAHERDGRIVFANPFIEILTGYSRAQILSQGGDFVKTIVDENDLASYQRSEQMIAIGEGYQHRCRLFQQDGGDVWVERRVVPLFNEQAEVEQYLSVLFDITSSVRYEHEIEQRNRDLQDITTMVSHDLKGPIATIRGMANIIKTEHPQASEPLSYIESALDRLQSLIASLINYGRSGSVEASRISLSLCQVVKDVERDLRPLFEKEGATLTVTCEPCTALADRMWVYQIISNLVGNALKYRDKTRPLEVRVTAIPKRAGYRASIVIQDNGLGIAQEKQQIIFRPFQRIHPEHSEGSGVGLATVKKLVEKLKGTVRIESTPGIGSTFTVEFPGVPME